MTRSVLMMLPAAVLLGWAAMAAPAQTGRKAVSATEVNGTFRMNFKGRYRANSNEIKILALGCGQLRIAMDLTYPYTMQNGEQMANVGQLDGEAAIDGDTAIYSSREFGRCEITIKFVRPGTIKVSQDGSDAACGFGNNVTADGTYRKVSSRKPKFENR